MERGEGARRTADAGAVRRDGSRARAAGGAARDPAPLRGDDQGDLVAAAALRAARRPAAVSACSSTALSRRARISSSCACESGELEGELAELADWWTACQDAGTRRARGMLKPDEAPKKRRRSRGRGRKRPRRTAQRPPPPTADASAASERVDPSTPIVGLGSNLAHPRRQLARAAARARAPAAHARRRRVAATTRARRSAARRPQPDYVNAVGARAHVAAAARAARRAAARSSAGSSRRRSASAGATRRGRSTSICYYSAVAASPMRGLTRAASAHARARVRAAPAARHRAGGRRYPDAGSRAATCADVRGQRIARTRRHALS